MKQPQVHDPDPDSTKRRPRQRLGVALSALVLLCGLAGIGTVSSSAVAAPTAQAAPSAAKGTSFAQGKQARPAVAPGSKHAKPMAPLGSTKQAKVGSTGKPTGAQPNAGVYSQVDFSTFYNYCWHGFTYTPVTNNQNVTSYVQVQLYEVSSGEYHMYSTSISAGSTSYISFDGIVGTYYAYLYYWNGSSYAYDEYATSTNNCSVSVTFGKSTAYPGYAYLSIKNTGTAYATVVTQELAPFSYGPHYNYPAVGGSTLVRYYWVGSAGTRYAIVADVDGATTNPWKFAGYY